MKYSFTTLTTPDYTIKQVAQAARLYGYDGVDIRVSYKRGELTLESSTAQIKEVRDCFDSEGIYIPSLLCYPETYKVPGLDTRALEDWIKRHIQIARALDVPAIRLFTLKTGGDIDRASYLDAYAQTLHKVLSAEKSGLQVLIQNHQLYATAKEALYIVDRAAHPDVGIVYSPDHCIMTGEDAAPLTDEIIKCTKQLYIADVMPGKEKFISVLPGKGSLPVESLYKSFLQQGFQGFVTFKWYKLYQPQLAEPEEVLPYFIKYMKSL